MLGIRLFSPLLHWIIHFLEKISSDYAGCTISSPPVEASKRLAVLNHVLYMSIVMEAVSWPSVLALLSLQLML